MYDLFLENDSDLLDILEFERDTKQYFNQFTEELELLSFIQESQQFLEQNEIIFNELHYENSNKNIISKIFAFIKMILNKVKELIEKLIKFITKKDKNKKCGKLSDLTKSMAENRLYIEDALNRIKNKSSNIIEASYTSPDEIIEKCQNTINDIYYGKKYQWIPLPKKDRRIGESLELQLRSFLKSEIDGPSNKDYFKLFDEIIEILEDENKYNKLINAENEDELKSIIETDKDMAAICNAIEILNNTSHKDRLIESDNRLKMHTDKGNYISLGELIDLRHIVIDDYDNFFDTYSEHVSTQVDLLQKSKKRIDKQIQNINKITNYINSNNMHIINVINILKELSSICLQLYNNKASTLHSLKVTYDIYVNNCNILYNDVEKINSLTKIIKQYEK